MTARGGSFSRSFRAELARELDLSRERLSQLCRIGLPVRPDGKLNRAEAVAWVKANVCSWHGGWWGDLRQKIPDRTAAAGADAGGGAGGMNRLLEEEEPGKAEA